MKILVTGASGFVGYFVCTRLVAQGHTVVATVRQPPGLELAGVQYCVVQDLCASADWSSALAGIETVVHCAARVHVRRDTAVDPLCAFRTANVAGTAQLARQAAEFGIRRFIFLSSVKVNGEVSPVPFRETDTASPQDAYGLSKYEAEAALREIARRTGMELVVVRPPLIYGPGVKANFRSLMWALAKGIPLPLGDVHNSRSFVAIENLVDLIFTCINHPRAANELFFASDGEDLSTPELIRRLALAMGRPARLLPVPPSLLTMALACVGQREMSRRLCGTLVVNISKARELLAWIPPVSVDEGLRQTAEYYIQHQT